MLLNTKYIHINIMSIPMTLAIIKSQRDLFCLLWIHIPTTHTGDLCAKHCESDTHYIFSVSEEESRGHCRMNLSWLLGRTGGLGCQARRQKGRFCGGHGSAPSSCTTECREWLVQTEAGWAGARGLLAERGGRRAGEGERRGSLLSTML